MSKHLITSDWHIRSTVPSCIEATPEEWMNFQKESVNTVLKIAKENNVDEIDIGGDLFHSEQPLLTSVFIFFRILHRKLIN